MNKAIAKDEFAEWDSFMEDCESRDTLEGGFRKYKARREDNERLRYERDLRRIAKGLIPEP